MKKILSKKILLAFLAFAFLASPFFASFAFAQDVELLPNASGAEDYKVETSPYEGRKYQVRTASPGFGDWAFGALGGGVRYLLGMEEGENVATWVGGAVIESLIGGVNVLLGGTGEEGDVEGDMTSNPLAHGGAIGMMGGMIGGVYQDYPSLGTGDFFKNNLADNLLTGSAYATGVEDIKKTGLNKLWEVMRNISYVFMVIILIAMGFMVMLRARIDPRTTMTLSAALPRVATSLILIAFSLPIAGIIIDLSSVLTGLVGSVFQQFVTGGDIPEVVGVGMMSIWNNFVRGLHIPVALDFGEVGTVVEFFIQLIIRVIAFAASIMIFWTLISRYASLLINVVFAPFAFLWGALPGQEDTTSRWFKSYIVNALTFPGIYLVINIANWVVRVSEVPLPPAWGDSPGANISGVVALSILLTATKIPAILEDALEVSAPAGVARAGLEPGKIIKQVPLIGRFAK